MDWTLPINHQTSRVFASLSSYLYTRSKDAASVEEKFQVSMFEAALYQILSWTVLRSPNITGSQ